MKKTVITIILSVLAVFACAFAFVACGSGNNSGGKNGETQATSKFICVDEGDGYAISLGRNLQKDVSIPSEYNGKPVMRIGDDAFSHCLDLTSITIPNSVTSIGDCAFYGCSSLTIYCEVSSKPSKWRDNWNYSNRPVIWGYKG